MENTSIDNMTDCWGVTNESWQIMYTQSGSFRKAKWLVHFLHAWTAMNGPWMACKEIHSIGPFLKPVKPYITQKTRAFQVGYKTGQYQLSDEHSTTILAIPPRKGRLLFPTQNNTLWGGGGGICLKITIFLYCLTAPKWMIQGSKV